MCKCPRNAREIYSRQVILDVLYNMIKNHFHNALVKLTYVKLSC